MTSGSKSGLKYSAPKLVVYGDMAKLTASGIGSLTENKGKDPSLNKKP
jgi:hypothetical protein